MGTPFTTSGNLFHFKHYDCDDSCWVDTSPIAANLETRLQDLKDLIYSLGHLSNFLEKQGFREFAREVDIAGKHANSRTMAAWEELAEVYKLKMSQLEPKTPAEQLSAIEDNFRDLEESADIREKLMRLHHGDDGYRHQAKSDNRIIRSYQREIDVKGEVAVEGPDLDLLKRWEETAERCLKRTHCGYDVYDPPDVALDWGDWSFSKATKGPEIAEPVSPGTKIPYDYKHLQREEQYLMKKAAEQPNWMNEKAFVRKPESTYDEGCELQHEGEDYIHPVIEASPQFSGQKLWTNQDVIPRSERKRKRMEEIDKIFSFEQS